MSQVQATSRVPLSFHDQRRSPRHHVQFPAWIDVGDGASLYDCMVLDVSDDGARIMLAAPVRLPKIFYLVFSKQAKRRRRCRMVWRLDEQIGLNYLGPLEADPLPALSA